MKLHGLFVLVAGMLIGADAPAEKASTLPPTKQIRFVNSKLLSLNLGVKGAEGVNRQLPFRTRVPGLTGIELWVARDGHSWLKLAEQAELESQLSIDLTEGLYGLTVVAKTVSRQTPRRPKPGDATQFWVEVDITPPQLRSFEVALEPQTGNVLIHWKAEDKNFWDRPVRLSYAAKPEGPWVLIEQDLGSEGKYAWTPGEDVPDQVYLEVMATDRAGNMTSHHTSEPIRPRLPAPEISILSIDVRR